MRRAAAMFLAAVLWLHSVDAWAAEKGLVIRAGDLMAQPFIDAAKTTSVTPNQPVTILERRGAWANVECNGQNGWIRLLNLRLDPGAGGAALAHPANSGSIPSIFQTGSSGRTVTTGVKGMNEEDIQNAAPDYAELELLGTLVVNPDEARANAQKSNLKENTVNYLDKGRGK